jgi:hypothetical protein
VTVAPIGSGALIASGGSGGDAARPESVDLRRAPLALVRALDLRQRERDLWADEQAVWDRFTAAWAGLDDAAWR